jgi:ppGpp synthetase/RelA/SpoT-type nucleotidyltranferase
MSCESQIQKAIEFATRAHQGQVDKSGVPIFFHLTYVASHGTTDEERVVGLLHDIIEDTEITADDLMSEGFTPEVIAAVELLTKRPGEDYFSYIERVATNPLAVRVKLVDLEHNMQLNRLPTPQERDLERLKIYRQAFARLTRIQRKARFEKELNAALMRSGGQISKQEEMTLHYQQYLIDDYRVFAQVLDSILNNICKEHAPLGIVQARAKSAESFNEKCLREGKDYCNPLQQLTDLAGARIIVTTKEELETVSKAIADLFEGERKEDISSARHGVNQFGYASIHFDNILFDQPVMMNVDTQLEFTEGLKGEIQVRTLCQHQYAAFVHDRAYKGGVTLDDRQVRKLSRMAAILEEMDEDFDELVQEIRITRKADAVTRGDLCSQQSTVCCPSCPHHERYAARGSAYE